MATLPDDHVIWQHAANALANLSIEEIVLGAGILKHKSLLPQIQNKTVLLLNGYLELPLNNMSSLITTSLYGDDAGFVGGLVLAHRALKQQQPQQTKQLL